ncbi:MAG: DUF4445 domain-containing protein [Gammaproteobacteria bacterium]|nr:DUF4445 domain-containing protein [Gammaproteobacteria bacterium]MBT5204269.1 DUF4445 domain-containing protein [Gammaproteobacteria bacterium]MBT5602158.1 DUF4445 domain-containing protein [Gammaproteobacteria bacterium]MBT6246121.1 DUF4445 domain-containing protein [Gammaproteobacteria bacterium]
MEQDQKKIVFTPSGRRGHFPVGTRLLDAARSLGVDVDSVCGGRGICGRCKVLCTEGDFSKHGISSKADHLSPVGAVETRFSEKRTRLQSNQRLSCQALVTGDLVIDVPPESQMHRQVVRKQAEHRDITLDPATHLYYVEVKAAELEDAQGDLQRLYEALSLEWGLEDLSCDRSVLQHLQQALRLGQWQVTVAVNQGSFITAIWQGYHEHIYGLALDIGSTTIAGHLCHLATGDVVATSGIMNPQIRFGEDLMSRVSYLLMHPEGGLEMTSVVREGINDLIASAALEAGIEKTDILEISIAANPIMHHLFLGLSPVELGSAPFALVTDQALNIAAREAGLDINAGGQIYVLPCIAGHVGADAAAMVLAEAPQKNKGVSLVVDVGTNAEIILANEGKLLACSSPTGPAFEGAQISCGQRAAPGAIERVRIDPDTLEVRFRVIGSELWSDESAFAASIADFGITGICGSGIIEAVAEMFLSGVLSEDGVIDGTVSEKSARVFEDGRTWSFMLDEGEQKIIVTQNDVRQIQLAKAALYAGVKLLLDREGVDKVDRIRLAGAFGSHIDIKYAMVLGLIPDCELAAVSSAGNAAGTGARIALLDRSARVEIEALVKEIAKIETAIEPKFQGYFVDAMAFPNKQDDFPNLFAQVSRPAVKASSANRSGRRSRRRSRPTT